MIGSFTSSRWCWFEARGSPHPAYFPCSLCFFHGFSPARGCLLRLLLMASFCELRRIFVAVWFLYSGYIFSCLGTAGLVCHFLGLYLLWSGSSAPVKLHYLAQCLNLSSQDRLAALDLGEICAIHAVLFELNDQRKCTHVGLEWFRIRT